MAGPRLQLASVGNTVSAELTVQLVVARHIHAQLAADDIRDVRLVVLLMEIESGRLSSQFALPALIPYSADVLTRLARRGGVSQARVRTAINRLLEAGALIVQEGPDPHLVFVERVLQPVGAAEYVAWPLVIDVISGHTPALLVLRTLVDHFRLPWDWTSVTYQDLAERCCYSLGMVRHGIDQLIDAKVLERQVHAGRGHEYRCSAWALGRNDRSSGLKAGASMQLESVISPGVRGAEVGDTRPVQAASGLALPVASFGETTVEIGDVVVRVPPGTVIRMEINTDGATVYHVGPHLRLTQRPTS